MIQACRQLNKNREGIALIMVIGLLALMMVLGVSFAIYMRTGSVSAGYFRGDVVTRQLLPAALNSALRDIEVTVGDNMYPPWDVLCSTGTADSAEVTNSIMLSWVPQSVLAMTNAITPTWQEVGNNCRVAYIVLNCSGLMDANYAGGGSRACGSDPTEIQISDLAEVNDTNAFSYCRPYETIQQLGMVGVNTSPPPLRSAPSSLVTYSYFPLVKPGETNGPVPLAGSDTNLMTHKGDIIKAFNKSVFAGANSTLPFATNLYNELLDYVDADDVPQNLWSPCTEAVPMFNEIQLTLKLAFSSNNLFSARGSTLDMEWAYPFITGDTSRKFEISYSLNFQPSAAGFPAITASSPLTNTIDSGYPGSSYEAPSVGFGNKNLNYSAFVGQSVTLTGQVALVMKLRGGAVVDAAPTNSIGASATIDFPMTFTVPSSPISPNPDITTNVVMAKDCTDPRFNWKTDHWRTVNPPATHSLRSENAKTTNFRTSNATQVDGDTKMYVANRPLQSLGELTYLAQADSDTKFWQTIRIYPTASLPVHPVLDYFTLATSSALKGVVNPNTRSVEVMKALLTDMRANEYPDGPNIGAPIDVQALANEWLTKGNPIINLSDLGQKCTNLTTVAPFNGSEFLQESLLRNMVGLLHPRQNYFMILLCAQSYTQLPKSLGVNQKISGLTAHGIAEVWRDPLPNSSGKHKVIIRMIKTVEE